MTTADLPAAYVEGVRLFNEREFFACHDVLEELWTETIGPERGFYQGLIHAAVALHHFEEGNLGGAAKMCRSTVRYLEPFVPHFMGLDVERFLGELRSCFAGLLDAREWPAGVTLDMARVPRIELPAAPPGE
jgi:predicted metal-dependent hydrolase